MRFFLIIFSSLMLVNCSTSNLSKLDDKNSISGGTDLIQTSSLICSEYKSTDTVFYACGSGYSTDLELSRSKAILQAKVNVADVLGSTVRKNENQSINETTKEGLNKKYNSDISNQVFETSLNKYVIVYDKSFYEAGKYRSFIILKYTQS
jgi:hypothetical protein